MGILFLQSWYDEDKEILEAISKFHKYDIKTVEQYYKEMLDKLKEASEKNETL